MGEDNKFSKGIQKMLTEVDKRINLYSDNSALKKELYGIKKQFELLEQDTSLVAREYAIKLDDFKKDIDSPNYSEELAICAHGKNLIWTTDMVMVKSVQLIDAACEAVANILVAHDNEDDIKKVSAALDKIAVRDEVKEDEIEAIKKELEKPVEKAFDFLNHPSNAVTPEVKLNEYEVNL